MKTHEITLDMKLHYYARMIDVALSILDDMQELEKSDYDKRERLFASLIGTRDGLDAASDKLMTAHLNG
ncbi:hypothetical protein ASG52_05425 [Methylobacterium sp. Leaf456]|uniref:hypothetical protein n=1 Tax=Methylobacterium sp. Leaf456 TaxID=1736382 RepID=UPI00071545C9|nr:hypothetical protein [Methylobacterium sp. Leaf456]KQT53557.1 hypothetical protein ASG52_05425 [Methylobacterium sp. Leaf456]